MPTQKIIISEISANYNLRVLLVGTESGGLDHLFSNFSDSELAIDYIDNQHPQWQLTQEILKNSIGAIFLNSNHQVIWAANNTGSKHYNSLLIMFTRHYLEDTVQTELFKWGNKIKEKGDYMCSDCGYILTVDDVSDFQVNMAFPSCEVCEAGSFNSATNPEEPFWQKI
jgi:hypothetical protein